MKKIVALAVALVLCLAMAIPAMAEADYNIVVNLKTLSSEYWQTVKSGIDKAAEELGITIDVQGPPAESDIAGQVNQIETQLGGKPDAARLVHCLQHVVRKAAQFVRHHSDRLRLLAQNLLAVDVNLKNHLFLLQMSNTCRPESPGSTVRGVNLVGLGNLGLRHGRNHDLRDLVALRDLERLVGGIKKNHPDLTAIAGVNRARGIEDGYSVFQRKPRARANLGFVSRREQHDKACMNEGPAPGGNDNVFDASNVHPRVARMSVRGDCCVLMYSLELQNHIFISLPPFQLRTHRLRRPAQPSRSQLTAGDPNA